ncbi:MAG: hypothetical protein ACO1Q7_04190 [Gemmatimonas sp.]
MYATCLHCAANLGANEAIEVFPVGRRLAFDPGNGRLWVICRSCERWNLSPLEERLEAIDVAEKLYRDSRLKVSTDNIGLARLNEGVELVRIGQPQRPEMAAWRYGDQFGRRRKRQMLLTGAAVGGAVALYGGGLALGISMASFAGIAANGGWIDALVNGSPKKVVGRIAGPDGRLLVVQRTHARMSRITRVGDAPFQLALEHTQGSTVLHGAEAARAAAQLLPTVNRFGGSKKDVTEAVGLLERFGSPEATLRQIQQVSGATGDAGVKRNKDGEVTLGKTPGALHNLPLQQRLALEMALHEESERRAMEGELKQLEQEWREAEVIAGIADAMFDSPQTLQKLQAMKQESVKPENR